MSPQLQLKRQEPIRILHCVGGMAHGGVETWLMHCMRDIDRDQLSMDFLVHADESCPYDDEIRELGGRLIACPGAHQPWQYTRHFRSCLDQYGPYDVVHSHLHHFSGYILRLAKRSGVPIRIAHSHNDISHSSAGNWRRAAYMKAMSGWIRRYATCGLACSQLAAGALYGADWQSDSRWQVLNYGLDFEPFREAVDAAALRAELGIPADAYVIGHVGRFAVQKNHRFLLEIMSELVQRDPNCYLLLVGDGPLKEQIQRYAAELGIAERVHFLGLRDDVPRVMKGAMDHFLFPSNFEGLGLVLIEAQAAGLPCTYSDVVPQEVEVVPPLLERVGLDQAAAQWANQVLAQRETHRMSPDEALDRVCSSPFNIASAVAALKSVYTDAMRLHDIEDHELALV